MSVGLVLLIMFVSGMLLLTVISLLETPRGVIRLAILFVQIAFALVATSVANHVLQVEGFSHRWSILPFLLLIVSFVVLFYRKRR